MSTNPCRSCGAPVAAVSQFCTRCGTPVASAPAQHTPAQPMPQYQYQQPPAAPVVVELPNWVTTDWGYPIKAALGAFALGLGAQAVLTGVLLVAMAIGSQLSPFPTKGIVSSPFVSWLKFHGAVEPDGLSMTGVAWIVGATVLSRRWFLRSVRPPSGPTPRQAMWIGSGKAAVVYGTVMLAIALAVKAFIGDSRNFVGFTITGGPLINPVAAFFLGAVAGFIGSVWMLMRAYGLTVGQVVGLNVVVRFPESVKASLIGFRRMLALAIGLSAGLAYVVFLVELGSSARFLGAAELLSEAIRTLVGFGQSGIDIGWGLFVYAARFFIGDLSVPFFVGKPSWIYVGIAIPFAAMLAGGVRAARSLAEPTQQHATEAGAFLALETMAFGLIAGLFWTRIGGGFVASSMFLPALWGAVAIAGAILVVRQPAVTVSPGWTPAPPQQQVAPSYPAQPYGTLEPMEPVPPQPTAAATNCAACGAVNAAGNVFCERCGTRL